MKPGKTYLFVQSSFTGAQIVPVEVFAEHAWGDPTYTWSNDNSQVTAGAFTVLARKRKKQ